MNFLVAVEAFVVVVLLFVALLPADGCCLVVGRTATFSTINRAIMAGG